MSDPINLSKFAELLAAEPKRKHNYYSPKSGQFAARFIESWGKNNGFQPTTMSAFGTGKSANSLAAQLRYGLQWLCENAEPADVRAFFVDLRPQIKIHTRHSSVDIMRIADPMTTLALAANGDGGLELRADLLGWVEANKPLRSKWERDGLVLSDENLTWFQEKVRELEEKGYCGVVKRHHVMVVHYPKNLLLGDTKDQP